MTISSSTACRLSALAALMALTACGGGGEGEGTAVAEVAPAPAPVPAPAPAPSPNVPAVPAPPAPTPPAPAPPAAPTGSTLSAGWGYTLALRADGGVLMLGHDARNQVGTTPIAGTFAKLINGVSATSVAAGYLYSLATGTDGKLYGWGVDNGGTLGGSPINGYVDAPRAFSGVEGVTMAVSTDAYAVALRSDGTVWHWPGVLTYSPESVTPRQITGLVAVVKIVPGRTGLNNRRSAPMAIKADGTVWTLAWNPTTVMGASGPVQTRAGSATQVAGLAGVTDIACGVDHCLALLGDGQVMAWGSNNQGQLGLGSGAASRADTPVVVSALAGVRAVGASDTSSAAVLTDGRVLAWGGAFYNGLGGTLPVPSPTPVPQLSNAVGLACDNDNCAVRLGNGSLWSWGANGSGELGNGATSAGSTPLQANGIVLD